MGIPYMIGIFSGVSGLPGFEVYVGLSIVMFWLALQAFHNLTMALFTSVAAQRIALAIFSFNLMVVHWSPACGFLPQVIGVGISCMLIATVLRLAPREEGSTGEWWKGGLLLAALIWSYPGNSAVYFGSFRRDGGLAGMARLGGGSAGVRQTNRKIGGVGGGD